MNMNAEHTKICQCFIGLNKLTEALEGHGDTLRVSFAMATAGAGLIRAGEELCNRLKLDIPAERNSVACLERLHAYAVKQNIPLPEGTLRSIKTLAPFAESTAKGLTKDNGAGEIYSASPKLFISAFKFVRKHRGRKTL